MNTASAAALLLTASGALAQYSPDPAANMRVCDHPGEQAQPKLAPTPDGGAYIAWFDNGRPAPVGPGYDVFLQRVDAAGAPQWVHNGILIAERGLSSTVDYDLITDAQGHALLAYNDDRGVPGTQQISVANVAPDGTILWTVTISNGSTFKSNPRIAQLASGDYIVGYTHGASPSEWIMQKLDASGQPQWPAPGITRAEAGRALVLCDLKESGGDVVALWMRASGTNPILSNKGLAAQKFDADGQPLWTASPAPHQVVLLDSAGGSIQNGYFPTFIGDGGGGAIFAWYEITTGARNAYLQHIMADGTLRFPSALSTHAPSAPASRIRLGAGVAFHEPSGHYTVVAPESDASPQGNYSIIAQRFDASGQRLFGESGITALPPVGANQPSFVQALPLPGGGALASWMETRDIGGTRRITAAARINADGAIPWFIPVNSDDTTDKGRLTSTMSTAGFAVLACSWGSGAGADIGLQNVNADGTLGITAACYANCDGSTIEPILNIDDFTCFINEFAAAHSLHGCVTMGDPNCYPNCDGSTTVPWLNVDDFICFINRFAQGCQ